MYIVHVIAINTYVLLFYRFTMFYDATNSRLTNYTTNDRLQEFIKHYHRKISACKSCIIYSICVYICKCTSISETPSNSVIVTSGASLVTNCLASNKGSGRLCLFLGTLLDLVQIIKTMAA